MKALPSVFPCKLRVHRYLIYIIHIIPVQGRFSSFFSCILAAFPIVLEIQIVV